MANVIDPRLAISDDVLSDLRRRKADGASEPKLVARLSEQGFSFGGAMLALARSGAMTLGEAKRAVHLSAAYAGGRQDREAFEQSAFDALAELKEEWRDRAA